MAATPTILLVQVDPETSARLRAAAGPPYAVDDVEGPEAALARLDGAADAVLVVAGERVEEPIRLAQQVGLRDRNLPVLLLAAPRRHGQLARTLQFTPFLGGSVACEPADDLDRLADAFRQALQRASRQREYEQMLRSVQSRLAVAPPPSPALLYLDQLLDRAPVGVVVVDPGRRIRAWNRHAATLFGLGEREALNRRLLDLFPEAERARLDAFLAGQAVAEADGHPETFVRSTHEGTLQHVEATASPVAGRGDEPGTMVLFQDVTRRIEAEAERLRLQQEVAVAAALAGQTEQLRQLNDELEQRNRELQDFAYVASHDLQEPLRKIRAFADLLASDYHEAVDEQGRYYLNRVQDAASRMSDLLSALLEYSRVSTRTRPFERVDLNTVAADVTADLEALAEEVGGRIELGPLPVVEADPVQMRQLLQNLAGNALKFRRDGVPPVVRVEASVVPDATGGSACRLTVADNGIGFDEKYLDRIFSPFERLHTRGTFAGTGMGLAICRRIVERHGGEITAHSTEGEGSTFVVTLPVSRTPPA